MEKGKRSPRKKKIIAEMMPVRKWLSRDEACSYLGISLTHFIKSVYGKNFTVSALGNKVYYRVSELDELMEENVIIKRIQYKY